ncbi:MAG: thioesterase domain-containing protein, partial [Verrucomicrobia bacterium]|nr:thioesterase domain-containing protein [Verrucomicrobiota bacterium]
RHLCVEDMAAHYAREIRACQPQGPYYLGGHSAGGWIAYATALELKRQGQPVAMLALLDTRPTVPLPWWVLWRGKTLYLMVRLWCHAKTFWQIKGQSRWKYFLGRLVALKNQIQQMRRHPVRASAPPTEARPSTPGLDYYAGRVRNYKPAVYDSLVDFFIAEDTGADQVSMLRHFLRGGINIHRVPGTHRDVLESHNLQAFSRVFAAALRKAQERARLSQPQ